MDTTDDFLELLGLDQHAGEREIRGAYARRLKRIDQEQDPEGFQRLRTAYETALDWARWKARQAEAEQDDTEPAHETMPVAAEADADVGADIGSRTSAVPEESANAASDAAHPIAPAPAAAPDPGDLAHAVFERLAQKIPELAAQQGARTELAAWKDELLLRLNDDELFNIDARITFEAIVATVLAQGWRPGHENLFAVAQEVFGWEQDRRRLLQFGRAGALLDQALGEQAMFLNLPQTEQLALRAAARALREPGPPETRRLLAAMPNVEQLVEHFPALAQVVVSLDNVDHWRAAWDALGGAALEPLEDLPEPPSRVRRWLRTGAMLLVVVCAYQFMQLLYNSTGHERGFLPPSAPPPAVSQEVLNTLIEPVRFKPSLEAKPGKLDTRVRVFLDQDLRVERTQNVQTSGEPAFDDAVRKTLAAAKPFPPGTPRQFELSFTAEVTAETPRAPVPPPFPQRAAGATPGAATLARHIPPIDYRPTAFAREGKLALRYAVFLDADGKVERIEQRQGSGEPRLDLAFERALRAAKPFPAATARSFEVAWSTTITRKTQATPEPEPASDPAPAAPAEPPASDAPETS
jgi:protein TonB